jgi:glycosyltransferase involved in cell wall biosynthesis
LNQVGVSNLRVSVLDDASTDDTAALLAQIVDSRLNVISGTDELPAGWLGKPWACARLAKQSEAEYLIFIDADVRLSSNAIAASIEILERTGMALVSPYPRQETTTLLTRLVQPLLQWSWLHTVPLKLAQKTTRKSLAVANGQFFVCRRSDYLLVGGHESVREEVLDDLMLLRSFYEHGLTGTVADGTQLATCRMYATNQDLVSGYTKSLWQAFNGAFGSVFTNLFLLTIYTLPLLGLFTNQWPLAVLALAGAAYGRLIVAVRTNQRKFPEVFTHSISIAIFAWLNTLSWVRHFRGTNSWKGRAL